MKRHYELTQLHKRKPRAEDSLLCGPLAKALIASNKLGLTLAYALAASGRVWDEQLNKMTSYRDLIHHPDETIRNRWNTSGENEFG